MVMVLAVAVAVVIVLSVERVKLMMNRTGSLGLVWVGAPRNPRPNPNTFVEDHGELTTLFSIVRVEVGGQVAVHLVDSKLVLSRRTTAVGVISWVEDWRFLTFILLGPELGRSGDRVGFFP